MHPVVIMAYDKSPAINKAVAALEEAGMEVRVLNTNHAKLADFLGALAGEEDDEEVDDSEPTDVDVVKNGESKETPPEESKEETAEEPIATESLKLIVDGEEITVQLVEGESELVPNGLMVGSKTAYMINESHYAFWPTNNEDGLFDLMHQVQVQLGGNAVYETVTVKEAAEKPVLRLRKSVYEALLKAALVKD